LAFLTHLSVYYEKKFAIPGYFGLYKKKIHRMNCKLDFPLSNITTLGREEL